MSPPDRLIAAELSASLGKNVIGRRIIVLESTGSTNDFLLQMLTPELPEGFVVFAEHQSAGRGQRGHRWESASHRGLWFSVLLRPRILSTESARLTSWAARAVANAIRDETALEPAIKPPNDVYISGRKVAGVLVETKAGRGQSFSAIVGIGVNINQAPEEFPDELRAPRRFARHGARAEGQPREVRGGVASRTGDGRGSLGSRKPPLATAARER